MNYIEIAWKTYDAQVLPKDAPAIQRKECKRAFFAGAQGLLGTILGFLEPGTDATEADLRRMDLVEEELDQFARDVLEGRQ